MLLYIKETIPAYEAQLQEEADCNSIQLLYSRLNSIIYIQVVHNNLRSI